MHENHLIHEKSPYLLQHAHNPVDWYPWGPEAFRVAKQNNLPIFLSIGYSTCHWCHVMEHESFEDEEVANLLNQQFIAIKVDREERPDIDTVYMEVCQSLTGSGGWPLTILMTPAQKPFFAGTYLPKHAQYGTAGLIELLQEVSKLWREQPEMLLHSSEQIAAELQERSAQFHRAAEPSLSLSDRAVRQLQDRFDPHYGGFGAAPKFPMCHNLLFLLRYAARTKNRKVQEMALQTLGHMYRGGLFDHIGGGCSRYSTDRRWLIPHFEKMLYDNALLAYTTLEAFQMTSRSFFRTMAEQTLQYLLRELTSPEGGFYCGQDADSDGKEGAYYGFTPQEIEHLLGPKDSAAFCAYFGITPRGNFEGQNLPNLLDHPLYTEPPAEIESLCKTVYQYRLSRLELHLDDKILTSWNALAIVAFTKAYTVLDDVRYLEAAQQAHAFLQRHLRTADSRLLVRWRAGEAAYPGQLDDYAYYAWALLELYHTTFDFSYFDEAVTLATTMVHSFFDNQHGGFYFYASDAEQLLTRPKEFYDGALPSGNAVATLVLVRLAALTNEPDWRTYADLQLRFLAGNIADFSMAHCFALLALEEALDPPKSLLCSTVGSVPSEAQPFLRKQPIHILVKNTNNAPALEKIAPYTANYPIPANGVMYYLCRNGACLAPGEQLEQLKEMR